MPDVTKPPGTSSVEGKREASALPARRLVRSTRHFSKGLAFQAFYLMSNSTVKDHTQKLEKYDTSTGTIRFPANKPLPAGLVKKLVKARIAENAKLSGKAKK